MEKKSIVKNSMYNMIYKGFTALFPVVTMTYISKILLADGVGAISYANTIVAYFVLLASLGLPFYGVKIIAQNRDSKKKLNTAFLELFLINTIFNSICIVLYYFIINKFSFFRDKVELLNIFGLMLIFNYFNIDWFYQGVEEYSYIASRSIIIKLISFVMMILIVKSSDDLYKYAIILSLATAGNYVLNAINLRKYLSLNFEKINIIKHLKPNFILFFSAIAQELYSTVDIIMLESFFGYASVGCYSNTVKVIKMVYTLVIAIIATFYPRISKYIRDNQNEKVDELLTLGTKIILMISIPGAIGIAMTSSYSVPVFLGNSFMSSINIMKILSVMIITLSISYLLGHVVLMALGKEKQILKCTLVGASINCLLNLLIIPIWNENGAAIASVISEVVVMIMFVWTVKKYIKIKVSFEFIYSLILSCLSMIVYIFIISLLKLNLLLSLVIMIFGGSIIYIVSMFLFKNETILYFFEILNKKRKENK